MDQNDDIQKLADKFIESFNELAKISHNDMVKKGWWEQRNQLQRAAYAVSDELGKFADAVIQGNNIALMHTELSEGVEGIRHGNPPDDKIPEFSSVESEFADTIIRIFDEAGKRKLRVAEAIIAKVKMNRTRSIRHGGKLT